MTTKNIKKLLNLLIYVFSSVVFFVSFLFILSTTTNIAKSLSGEELGKCSPLKDDKDLCLGSGNLLDFDGSSDKKISGEVFNNFGKISVFFSHIIQILIWLSSVIVVVMFAYHGFLYVISGIKGDVTLQNKSKEYLTYITIALLAILSSYIILKQVNPKLVEEGAFEQHIKTIQEESSELLKTKDSESRNTEPHEPGTQGSPKPDEGGGGGVTDP